MATTIDPTQSTTLRKSFARELRGRWRTLRGNVRNYFEGYRGDLTEEALVLRDYRNWFRATAYGVLVETDVHSQILRGDHWTGGYIRDAYRKGLRQARQDLHNASYPESAVTQAVNEYEREHRQHMQREMLATYTELEGVAEKMLTRTSRIVKEGLQDRANLRIIIRDINDEIDKHGVNATNALANTSTVGAVNEALLTSYELIGVPRIGVDVEGSTNIRTNSVKQNAAEAEFTTAGDDRVCEVCAALEGEVVSLTQYESQGSLAALSPRSLLPVHPNCRCRWEPTPPDEEEIEEMSEEELAEVEWAERQRMLNIAEDRMHEEGISWEAALDKVFGGNPPQWSYEHR